MDNNNQQQSPQEPDRIVNIKCRQKGCKSMTARVQIDSSNGPRMYVCTECGVPQAMNPGGYFPY